MPVASSIFGSFCAVFKDSLLREGLTVFLYHDVCRHPSAFAKAFDLYVSPETFDFQIGFINKTFNVIGPDELLSGRIPQRAALITFDDGFKSYFNEAVPIMEKHSTPSIIFLNMEPVKGGIFFAGLAAFLCKREDFIRYLRKTADRGFIETAPFLSCDWKIINAYLNQTGVQIDQEVKNFIGEFCNENDLEKHSKNKLVFYGNHLFNHNVARLMSNDELFNSFDKNRKELVKYCNYRDFFSFPFGQPGSCYGSDQGGLLLDRGAKKVFASSGFINGNSKGNYLDRIALTSFHNSSAKIWFQVHRRGVKNEHN